MSNSFVITGRHVEIIESEASGSSQASSGSNKVHVEIIESEASGSSQASSGSNKVHVKRRIITGASRHFVHNFTALF